MKTLGFDLSRMDVIANKLAEDAEFAENFTDRLDAFKVLTQYLTARAKHKGKEDDAEDDGASFGNFASRIASASEEPVNGRATEIRSRSRRRTAADSN